MQAESALQLLEALPAPTPAVGSAAGGVVDAWA